jgi:predicted MPP superfamily phosphohydrolase
VLLLAIAVLAVGFHNATADPLVRRITVVAADYPKGAPPLRVVLFSDLHVHGPDMPPRRAAKLVTQINVLRPDIVIATGDFVGANWIGRRYDAAAAVAPLSAVKATHGTYAVLGNNDHQAGAAGVAQALRKAGVRVLVNEAVQLGPIGLAGIDGRLFKNGGEWQARRQKVYAGLAATSGAKLLVAHRPDEFAWSPPWIDLVLAGHTHCGQIVLPLVGAIETGSDFGERYRCGAIRERDNLMIVTAGLGTSRLPLRFGAPPDIWLVELRGAQSQMVGVEGPAASE